MAKKQVPPAIEVEHHQGAKQSVQVEGSDLLGLINSDVEMNWMDVIHLLGKRMLVHQDDVIYTRSGNKVTPTHNVERGTLDLAGHTYTFVV